MESVHGIVAGMDVHKKTVVVVVLHSEQPDQDHASGIRYNAVWITRVDRVSSGTRGNSCSLVDVRMRAGALRTPSPYAATRWWPAGA